MKFICFILLLLSLISCDKKLDSISVDDKNIELEFYRISRITSSHDYIDLTLKSSNEKVNIYETNSYQIDSLFIRNDSIFIINKNDEPVIYNLINSKFDYKIVLH